MHIACSLEAVEGEETGRRARKGHTQTRFAKEEGYESDTTRIVEHILAKLGPELRPSRDPKSFPPMPGPQRARSAERTTPLPPRKYQPVGQK